MNYKEIRAFFPYYDDEEFNELIENTLEIRSKIEDIDLTMGTQIPVPPIPQFELGHLFEDWYEKYEYIRRYAYSNNVEDRYFLYFVEQ
jgi:DNA polymerase-3 subunit alpha